MSDGIINGSGPAQPEGVPVGVQLGLGAAWQPAGAGASWIQLGIGAWVLRIETAAGVFGIYFDDQGMRRFISNAQSALTGIVLPS